MESRMRETGKGKEGTRPLSTGSGYMRLDARRLADDLAVELFRVTKDLPGNLRWLATQIARAATSAPANIAEGYARASNKEFFQHLSVAHGSLYEVEYYVHFMSRTQLLDAATCDNLRQQCQRASRTAYGLMKAVRTDTSDRTNRRRYLRELPEVYATIDDE